MIRLVPALGYAVISGVRIPVAGISLAGGRLVFTCQKGGPLHASATGPKPVTVFGEDGIRICQGDTNASWREVREGEVLEFTVSMTWTKCYGDAEVPGGQAG